MLVTILGAAFLLIVRIKVESWARVATVIMLKIAAVLVSGT